MTVMAKSERKRVVSNGGTAGDSEDGERVSERKRVIGNGGTTGDSEDR